jgi:hypothetical protein
MYAGAALAVLNVIVSIARIGSLASSLVSRSGYATSQAHSIAMQHTLPIAAGGMIAASLLVLSTQGLGVTIVGLVNWLVAQAATICLWRRDASQYFTQSRYREATQHPAQSRYF